MRVRHEVDLQTFQMAGIAAAVSTLLGAPDPFSLDDTAAVRDDHQMQRPMLGRVLPEGPREH